MFDLVSIELQKFSPPEKPEAYIPSIRIKHHIDSLDISEAAALHVAKLPPSHMDPFDRLLVAHALTEQMIIVTPDELIAQYGVPTMR